MEYSPEVLRRFDQRAHAGRIGDAGVSVGRAGKRRNGSDVVFYLRVAGDRVAEARFEAFGCPHTIAAADYVAESIEGLGLSEVRIDPRAISESLLLPAGKLGQVLIVEDALRAAIENAGSTSHGKQ